MGCDCFGQTQKTIKNKAGGCFVCRGDLSGLPRVLKAGLNYPACAPLVQAETKQDALELMTDPTQCIVAFTGDCPVDATEWAEDKKHPVYDDVIAIKQCVNWPEDEEGNSLFTLEDLEMIYQGHTCCIRFIDQLECSTAPEWLQAQQEAVAK